MKGRYTKMVKISGLTKENITMDKLNGNYVEFQILTGSGDVYYPYYSNDYNHVFKIENNQAFDYTFNPTTGQLDQDPKPVVSLQDITVTDDSGKASTVPGVVYVAERYVDNPYDLNPGGIQQSAIIGEPAVSFIQALAYYLQSLQFFSYDSYDNTEVKILDSLYSENDSTSTTTTSTTKATTTSTTTVAPTTTTTTTNG